MFTEPHVFPRKTIRRQDEGEECGEEVGEPDDCGGQ
jgi:hypothetical protein